MTFSTTTLDHILSPYQGRKRDALLPILWEIQTAFGYISADSVHAISHLLHVPEADIYGVISFYTFFHAQATGKTIIRICTSPICALFGGEDLLQDLCQHLGIEASETTSDGSYTVESCACLGRCDHAPAALISHAGEFSLAPIQNIQHLLSSTQTDAMPTYTQAEPAVLLQTPSQTYSALQYALKNYTPSEIIQIVEDSGLIGRGGAAFPTGLKWKSTHHNPYLVCNADESEPGTFKDRILLETQAHLLLEGMVLCAYAIGASQGYLFIRGEYPEATAILVQALSEAKTAGYLGQNILGSNFSFEIELRRGGGAYICGEETALFEAIEGKRGFPRLKPPYPTTEGLFGKPTVINNVETLAAIPTLVEHGAAWFKSLGTAKSSGSKLVSVSGHIKQAGVFEIEPGLPLRKLLDDYCGGVEGELQAVLMGGAAGTFLTPAEIDVPLTFEDLRAIGSTFGSGAVMVFNTTVDLRAVLRQLAAFFQHESCGKCFPCQLGTQRQLEILARPAQKDEVTILHDLGWTMTEASLCGLGQTAASAVLSALQKFPHLFG